MDVLPHHGVPVTIIALDSHGLLFLFYLIYPSFSMTPTYQLTTPFHPVLPVPPDSYSLPSLLLFIFVHRFTSIVSYG